MTKDFYLQDSAVASYLEKDWSDQFIERPKFGFAPYDEALLFSDYHAKMAEFLAKYVGEPKTMLEVGSALGRTFYEVCTRVKSLESATLLEPSQNLFGHFQRIFTGNGHEKFSILKGNVGSQEVSLDTKPIQEACFGVMITHLNIPFQKAPLGKFDLVICANVIDQCQDHLQLAEFLQNSVSPGGILLLSCTYQWQEKYIGNAVKQVANINDLFGTSWRHLGETNIPFQIRISERYWMTFLSHVTVFTK